ncbi:MAG: hypothetical protein ACOY31_11390 [Bacillota bacterium]
MNNKLRNIFRVAGFGLIIFGLVGNLPQGWAMASVGIGFVSLIALGGGGG